MTQDTPTTSSSSPATAPQHSSPILFLSVCAVFMLIGILVLAWLGTDRSRSAVGKKLPEIVLDPLINTEQKLTTEQIVGQDTILYLWSPTAQDAAEELQRVKAIAQEHPKYSFVPVAFSEDSLVVELLRAQVQQMLEQRELKWPTYVDTSGRASMEFAMLMPYGSFGFPTIFVIDQQGKISFVCEARKPENWQELTRHLDGKKP